MKFIFSLLILGMFCHQRSAGQTLPLQLRTNTTVPDSVYTWAIIVGISEYPYLPSLNYAHRDAEAFATYLRIAEGHRMPAQNVYSLINEQATRAKILGSLDEITDLVKAQDRVIIYFAGHGFQDSSRIDLPSYLMAYDTFNYHFAASGVLLDQVQSAIATIAAKNASVFVYLDACRAGAFGSTKIGSVRLIGEALARQIANEVKILACQTNEESIEDNTWGGGHGLFTFYLLKGLKGEANRDTVSDITLYELERYLKDHVKLAALPRKQSPFKVGDDETVVAKLSANPTLALRAESRQDSPVISVKKQIKEAQTPQPKADLKKNRERLKKAIEHKKLSQVIFQYQTLAKRKDWNTLKGPVEREIVIVLSDYLQQRLALYFKTSDAPFFKETHRSVRSALTNKEQTDVELTSNPNFLRLKNADSLLYVIKTILPILKSFKNKYLITDAKATCNFFLGLYQSDDRSAERFFTEAIALKPEVAQAYIELGVLLKESLTENAFNLCQNGVNLAPNWPYAINLLKRIKSSPPQPTQTLHFIVFTDTKDPDTGDANFKSATPLVAQDGLAQVLARASHLPLHLSHYYGDEFKLSVLDRCLHDLQVGKEDVVFFLFIGHGFNSRSSEYPALIFDAHNSLSDNSIRELTDIYEHILAKQPRLTVVMADASNSDRDNATSYIDSQRSAMMFASPSVGWQKQLGQLLSWRGSVLMSSAKRGQLSSFDKTGKLMTHSLTKILLGGYVDEPKEKVTWTSIVNAVIQQTEIMARSNGQHQTPQASITVSLPTASYSQKVSPQREEDCPPLHRLVNETALAGIREDIIYLQEINQNLPSYVPENTANSFLKFYTNQRSFYKGLSTFLFKKEYRLSAVCQQEFDRQMALFKPTLDEINFHIEVLQKLALRPKQLTSQARAELPTLQRRLEEILENLDR